MAVAGGMSFELNLSAALEEAKKLDHHFDKMVEKSLTISKNMRSALSAGDSDGIKAYVSSLKDLRALVGDIGSGKLAIDVDSKNVERLRSAIGEIVKWTTYLGNEGVELFDTKGVYASNEGLLQAEKNLAAVSGEIQRIREEWAKIDSWDVDNMAAAAKIANPRFTDRQARKFVEDGQKKQKESLEKELAAEIEKQEIAKNNLNFAKMTQDQKTEYIKKKIKEILDAEKAYANSVRREYAQLYRDLKSQQASIGAIDAQLAKGKVLSPEMEKQYNDLVNLEKETKAQMEKIEQTHLDYVSDLRVRYATRDAKEIAKILKNEVVDPQTALQKAADARTGLEMEAAKDAVQGALMTVDKDDLKTIAELNKAYIDLRANIEKLTKAQNNERTLQPTLRNEYARILAEIDKVTEAKTKLEATKAYEEKDAQAVDDYKALEAREADLMRRKAEIRNGNEALLTEIETKHEAERAQKRTEALLKYEKELADFRAKYGEITSFEAQDVIDSSEDAKNVRQSQKAIEDLKEARAKLSKEDANYDETLEKLNAEIKKHEEYIESVTDAEKYREKQQKKERETYKGAMDFSKQVKSVNDLQQAIKYLEAARNAEDLSTEEGKKRYRELTNELKRQQKAFEGLSNSAKRNGRHLLNIGDQLARKFALVFSVSQIQGYIHSLMQIRGEFELQQRSLQAILQDQDKANNIWQKTVDLAVRSPFRVKELVTYTKQLAAYRIEANKLYDTNKMLADVSAGLGVDMDRLILAFGQVKAANFLRGTELRQFTEAGIPMLDELAKHFNEMNGTALKSADIFEMISKRMIYFEDVEAVFKRLTSEGGRFYQMQEIQAETLQGQISNLRDSIDLMLNDIGVSMEDTIKKSVEKVRILVENWQKAADILKFVVAGFGAYKLNTLLTDKALMRFAISQGYATAGSSKLTKGLGLTRASFAKLFTTIKTGLASSGWLLAIAAILDVIMRTVQWNRKLNASIAEVNQRYYEQSIELNKVTKEYNKLTEAEREEGADSRKIFEDKKEQLEELLRIAKERSLDIEVNLNEIKQEEIDNIVNQIREQIIYAADWGKEFGIAMAKGLGAAQGRFLGINFFGDNLETDIKQLNNAIADIGGATKNQLQSATVELEARYDELSNVAQQAYDELQKGKTDEETEQQWLERRIALIYKAQEAEEFYGRAGVRNAKAIKEAEEAREKIARRREEVESEITKVVQRQLDAYGVEDFADLTPETQRLVQYEIDEAFSDMQISGELKRWAAAFASEKFKIQYVIEPPKPDDESLLEWQEAYNKYISSFSDDTKTVIKSITNAETEREALAKQIRETKGIYDNIVKAYESGAKAYSKEEYEQAKKIAEEAKKAQIWLEGISQDKGQDLVAEKLKERINLIKEMNKEYEKLRKDMSKEEAEAEVRKAYAATAQDLELDISTMDFDDEGTIFSLKSLKKDAQYKAKEYAFEIQKALDGYEVELKIETKTEDRKKLKEKFDEMLDMVNLSEEMKDLGIPESIAEVFDVEYISLDAVKSNIKKAKNMFDALGEDGAKLYEEYLEKIDKMEDEDNIERMKTYSKYLLEGMNERVRLKMEELKKLKEIEEVDAYSDAQKARIKAQVSKEAKAEQQKLEWQDFQGSEMYTMMFDDIEFMGTKALEVLKKKLEELKGSLKDLPASEVKEIVNQISRIEDITIERNPFASMRDAMKEVKELQAKGRTEEMLQQTFADAETKRKSYQDELDAINLVLNAKDKEGLLNETSAEWQEKYGLYVSMSTEELEQQALAYDALATGQEMVATNAKNDLDAYADARKALKAVSDQWGAMRELAGSAWDSAKTIMESLGVESDSLAMTIGDTAMSMVDLVFQAVQFHLQLQLMTAQAEILNVTMNTALGPIGWIVLALQAIATLLSAILGAKDKALQKQVEANLATVEKLQKTYEGLEESIDSAWDTASIQAYNQELKATTKSMITAQKAAIAAQSKRKGANKEGSDAYNELQDMKEELNELEAQLEESLANSFSKVTDGILDGVHDAAREFTDAWWEAFVETGDGLKGLEDNFNEMFLNLVKNQAAMQITGAFAEKWKKDLEKYINEDDTELTKDEAREWAEKVRATFPELSSALEGYLGVFKDMASEAQGSGLSALQKGIQGVTEETAQVLESLLNSMRFTQAETYQQVKEQTGYIKDIRSALRNITKNGMATTLEVRVVD